MKVYIGPYPNNHWSTRKFEESIIARRHGKQWGWEVEEEEYDRVDRAVVKLCDWWQTVLNYTINPILRYRKRKIKIRIDPSDTWSMDHTLGLIILPMLKQLRDTKHGSPWIDDEDVPHLVKKKKKKKSKTPVDPSVRALDVDEEDQHSDVHIRWEWALNEMIWAFEQIVDEDEGRNAYYVPYEEGEEVDLGLFWTTGGVKKYLFTEEESRKLGKYDPELHKKHQERVNNGLKLFGKYYQGLWD